MFPLKNTLPHVAAIVAGGITFKALQKAEANEATIILGTAAVAGATDIAVSAAIQAVEKLPAKPEVPEVLEAPEAPQEGAEGAEDSEYVLETEEGPVRVEEFLETDETEQEEPAAIDWLAGMAQIENLAREAHDNGMVRYKFGDFMVSAYELYREDEQAYSLLDPIYADKLVDNNWEEIPQDAASIVIQAIEHHLTVNYKPQPEEKKEEVQDDSTNIHPPQEEAADAEPETLAQPNPSDQFAEAFVEAAESGDEAVASLLDQQEESAGESTGEQQPDPQHIEGSVLNFAQQTLPSDPAKAKRNQRRQAKKEKDSGDKSTRTEQKFQ